jgi:hypothetical protein
MGTNLLRALGAAALALARPMRVRAPRGSSDLWEYLVIVVTRPDWYASDGRTGLVNANSAIAPWALEMAAMLNIFGNERWELAAVQVSLPTDIRYFVYLKRPK